MKDLTPLTEIAGAKHPQYRVLIQPLPIALALALLWQSVGASAQTIPGSVDPGRVPQQFNPIPGPAPTPEVISPQVPGEAPPTDLNGIRFTLQRLVVDGSTVYSEAQLNPIYREWVGREVSLADIFRIAEKITEKYRADGYPLCLAVLKAQRISGGEVHISIVEGFIDRVLIKGNKTPAIQAYADRLVQSRPLRDHDLQRYLLLLNDLAGTQARAVLAASPDVNGASDLTILIESRGVDFTASVDNRGSRYVGPVQLIVEAALNDQSGLSDRLSYRYVTTPFAPTEMRLLELGYALPLGSDGVKLELTVDGNQSMPGSGLQASNLQTKGSGVSAGAKLAYAFLRSQRANLLADISFDSRKASFDQFSLPSMTRMRTSYEDRVRSLRAGLSYDAQDAWYGTDFIRLALSRGLPILDATPQGSLSNTSRPGGRSVFTRGSIDASRIHNLNGVEPGLDLLTAVSLEWSFGQRLLASEQFGVGGSQYGRGYDPSELTGDFGAAAKMELQYEVPVSAAGKPHALQTHVFYDFGFVGDHSLGGAIPVSPNRSLASTGAGLQLTVSSTLVTNFELTKPLTRPVAAYAQRSQAKPLRAFIGLVARF